MTLTQEQIEDLYQFTKKHFVEWYDLQTELVDHLANDIEQIISKNPNLTFIEACDIAFKKFGVFGFMEMVEAKQKQLSKHYWKLILKEFKLFFTIPKIVISVSLFFFFYLALFHLNINRTIWPVFYLLISIIPLFYLFKNRKKLNNKVKQTGKKYLLEEYGANLGGIAGGISIPLQIALQIKNYQTHNVAMWLSLFTVFYLLFLYISIFEMPKKINEILIKEQPKF